MTTEMKTEQQQPATKEDIRRFVAEIEKKVIASNQAYLHSVLALDRILRQPRAAELLDDDLKEQMKDLWIKLKSAGLNLTDPPILFGLPTTFAEEKQEEIKPVSGKPEGDGPGGAS